MLVGDESIGDKVSIVLALCLGAFFGFLERLNLPVGLAPFEFPNLTCQLQQLVLVLRSQSSEVFGISFFKRRQQKSTEVSDFRCRLKRLLYQEQEPIRATWTRAAAIFRLTRPLQRLPAAHKLRIAEVGIVAVQGTHGESYFAETVMNHCYAIFNQVIEIHQPRIQRRKPRYKARDRHHRLAVILGIDRNWTGSHDVRHRLKHQPRFLEVLGRVAAHGCITELRQRFQIVQQDRTLVNDSIGHLLRLAARVLGIGGAAHYNGSRAIHSSSCIRWCHAIRGAGVTDRRPVAGSGVSKRSVPGSVC